MALLAAGWLIHLAARNSPIETNAPFGLREAQRFFPSSALLTQANRKKEIYTAVDRDGRELGTLLTTSPQSDFIIGYVAPNNVLVALDPKGRVIGAELLSSGDTRTHVADVKSDAKFWQQFIGWTPSLQSIPKLDAVGGSTLTSLGIAESLQNRLAGRTDSLRFPDALTLAEIQQFFPTGGRFEPLPNRVGWHAVKDNAGSLLGFAVRTSPASDYNLGHSGPTESLVAVAPDMQQILGVRIRRSYDTADYVENVREDTDYLKQLAGFKVDEWAKIDLKKSGLEGVSGATETSFAVAEGIRRRFATLPTEQRTGLHIFKVRDGVLLGVVGGSLVMSFSGLRTRRWVRFGWQAILIFVFGLWSGDLLSLALLGGWARHGVALEIAPSLVLLVAVALLVPWATRRQIYCNELCPHGAAQEWLGKFKKLHIQMSPAATDRLRSLPGILLLVAVLLAVFLPRFDLAQLEPFDAWALRGAWAATTIIAIGGLIASLFVPMAYCRFGCPTGVLLRFLKTAGDSDRFSRRDAIALMLLVAAAVMISFPRSWIQNSKAEDVAFSGTAFGTTWNVTIRRPVKDPEQLHERLSVELERIESSLSHWRSNSATARFNAARTTYPVEVPRELITLVAHAQHLSALSEGAFDITVAPLVRAWGFGPGSPQNSKPSDQEIQRIRSFVGWEKLTVDTNDLTLRKSHPELQIDLGAILQGYGADCLAPILNESGSAEYLIEVGGELLARGQWHVAIENPAAPDKPLRTFMLHDRALATSGTYRAGRSGKEVRWSHIINPQTGLPVAHDTFLVSVLHRSCLEADALSTTLLVLGADEADSFVKTNQLTALLITPKTNLSYAFPEDVR